MIEFKHIEYKGTLTNKNFTKKRYSAGIIAWNIRPFPALFFNHFIQPSPPPIVKLKSLHCVSRGHLPSQKCSHLFVVCHPYDAFKISPNQ